MQFMAIDMHVKNVQARNGYEESTMMSTVYSMLKELHECVVLELSGIVCLTEVSCTNYLQLRLSSVLDTWM